MDLMYKFMNTLPNELKSGDYLQLKFISLNQKKKGGINFRINNRTFLLVKKSRKRNSLTLLVSSLYEHEKVKFRYIVDSPHMISIHYLGRSLQ
jgi:hypothetical protein